MCGWVINQLTQHQLIYGSLCQPPPPLRLAGNKTYNFPSIAERNPNKVAAETTEDLTSTPVISRESIEIGFDVGMLAEQEDWHLPCMSANKDVLKRL